MSTETLRQIAVAYHFVCAVKETAGVEFDARELCE